MNALKNMHWGFDMWKIKKIDKEGGNIVRNRELAVQLLNQFNVNGDWEMVEITEYVLGDPMEQ